MKKNLILYYSYTGNTKIVAKQLAQKIDCDVVKLEPKVPFSKNYDDVVNEWQNNSPKRNVEIKDINANINEYKNIVVCSPIWWYSITPVITKFLKASDLSNKNIYPVLTSAGWFGNATNDIKSICKNSNIKQALLVTFDEDYSIHKIVSVSQNFDKWAENLK